MTIRNIIIALSLTALVSGCGGSTSKSSRSNDTVTEQRSEEQILESESVFDAESLTDVVRLIEAGESFSPTDMASIINQTEAQSNRLSAELELMLANDDPADTYNVMTELSNAQWIKDLNYVLDYLKKVPLSEQQTIHLNTLLNANRRINSTIVQLETNHLNGRHINLRLVQ